ncbi:alpha/beta hydrolase [Candidatus Cardinium sp. cBcalN1]|uniref:lipase family alpha/beta hydrolase n=1 Tax=Candidatus Cardinium sp. cBcalN1 TaxID=2699437 RepID=UPI001FB36AE6|nr:alpha/beta hydrolase [Candidatus Cardinium sp. cBcalN1]
MNLKQDKGNPVIALLHGLNSKSSCFNSLKENLEQAFPDALVVALTSVENHNTVVLSIKEQANSTFKELLEKIPDVCNRPILLIGHSQGGLRAYKMYDAYNDLLNVKGIITLATPWEGAPVTNADQALLSEYCQTPFVWRDIQKFSMDYEKNIDFMNTTLQKIIKDYQKVSKCSGIIDLKPQSKFLCEVAEKLPKLLVPILAIGGAQSDFRVFLSKKSNYDFKNLRNVWTMFIVGEPYNRANKAHDMVVPLYSQHADNIARENKNFERFVVLDALHDEVLLLPPEKKFHNILEHPRAFEKIKEFAKRVLSQPSNQKTNTPQSIAEVA